MSKTKKPSKLKAKAKAHLERESKLLAELCAKHGYAMQDAPKGRRIVMTFLRNVPKPRVEASYRIYLVVPSMSALGKDLAKRYAKPETKTKT